MKFYIFDVIDIEILAVYDIEVEAFFIVLNSEIFFNASTSVFCVLKLKNTP